MSKPPVIFDNVWKKFRRGERHDSLRDLLPAALKRIGRKGSDDLGKEEFWAVRDVSFEVQPGEAVGIIGSNGAGKSTSLKLLTRILKPNRGRIDVRGRVGALIEVAAGFHPDLTGRENVYLQGAIMGMRRDEIQSKFDAIVDFAGISAFIDTQVKRYSSGMHARLGFSIAAHLDPDVLFIDEVLSVGDAMFQARCLERIRKLKANGVALVFVSHNLPAVESLCDRVIWMQKGEMRFLGDPRAAVNAYLSNNDTTKPATSSQFERQAGRRVQFEEIAFTDVQGNPVDAVTSGAPTVLRATLACYDGPAQAIVGFGLLDDGNHSVFGENNTVASAPFNLASGDRLDLTVNFESLVLPEGRYHLQMRAEDPLTYELFHDVERAIVFDVTVPREFNRVGSVRLPTAWGVTHVSSTSATRETQTHAHSMSVATEAI